jgi:hypothetical protein
MPPPAAIWIPSFSQSSSRCRCERKLSALSTLAKAPSCRKTPPTVVVAKPARLRLARAVSAGLVQAQSGGQQLNLVTPWRVDPGCRRAWCCRDLGVGHRRRALGQNRFDLDLGTALINVAQPVGSGVREVDDAIGMERTAVDDAHDDGPAVADPGHPGVRGNRQRRVGSGHRKHVIGFADRGLLAVELLAVPARDSPLLMRSKAGVGLIGLAENDIWPVSKAMQRFEPRLRVGDVVEIVGDFVGGSVILVVRAPPLLDDARFTRRLRRRLGRRGIPAGHFERPRRLPATSNQQRQQQRQAPARSRFSAPHFLTSMRCVWMLIRMPTAIDSVTTAVPP